MALLPSLVAFPFAGSSASEANPGIALKELASGFVSPVALVSIPNASGDLLVADQIGIIYALTKQGALIERPFLNLTNRIVKLNQGFDERGLLGLALHPRFAKNRKLYVCYSAPLRTGVPTNWNCTLRVSEFKAAENDPTRAEPSSERVLLQIDKPYFNHNGGCLAFGPDGYLYISVGDGGNANDEGIGHSPQGNGQDLTTLLGKMLRIDVDKGNPYAIPSKNPFVERKGFKKVWQTVTFRRQRPAPSVAVRPEIFAYGLRNSWRMSFDLGGRHELFAADVGQTMFEEVNIITKGANYGWRVREGFHCFDPKNPKQPPVDCPKSDATGLPFTDPIFEYKNVNGFRNDPEALGISVTGGFVYRGQALPELQGRYVFADWSRNFVLPDGIAYVATRPSSTAEKKWSISPLDLTTHPNGKIKAFVVALGQDADGELYIMTNNSNQLTGKTGKVYKLMRADPSQTK